MHSKSIALMLYGDANITRDALTDDKYKDLAAALSAQGYSVSSILYNDSLAERLARELQKFDAVLVWVNPIEQGRDRRVLDSMLAGLSANGCLVATHPSTILKIGTKDILYKTKDMAWGGDTKLYPDYRDFCSRFLQSLVTSGIRVLKQYRGDGGQGVYKVVYHAAKHEATLIHAPSGSMPKRLSIHDLCAVFEPYFENGGLLIDQEWNAGIVNGMVRCYLVGSRVAGFGYQEAVALHPAKSDPTIVGQPPSKRYYFSEDCGLFQDLRRVMEDYWVQELAASQDIDEKMLPVLWDADFFINDPSCQTPGDKYTLCEINVSCVSPFPPSAIKHVVREVGERLHSYPRRGKQIG